MRIDLLELGKHPFECVAIALSGPSRKRLAGIIESDVPQRDPTRGAQHVEGNPQNNLHFVVSAHGIKGKKSPQWRARTPVIASPLLRLPGKSQERCNRKHTNHDENYPIQWRSHAAVPRPLQSLPTLQVVLAAAGHVSRHARFLRCLAAEHRLDLEILLEAEHTVLAAVTGLLIATEWHFVV